MVWCEHVHVDRVAVVESRLQQVAEVVPGPPSLAFCVSAFPPRREGKGLEGEMEGEMEHALLCFLILLLIQPNPGAARYSP